MYVLLGITLLFALLLLLNLMVSVSASAVWRVIAKPARHFSSKVQEQIIFALRIFPVVAASIFVLTVLVPAYLLYEPEESGEVISFKLAIISLLSIAGIFLALFRVLRTGLKTRRLLADWIRNSEKIQVDGVSVPIYKLQHPYPVIAVVGIFRPRMFVASQIFAELTPSEFYAAVEHEKGHLAAHDNFKRTILNVCRDVLMFPVGEGLFKAWSGITETVADEYAACKDSQVALDLASALVKIARIAPQNAFPAMPSGSFLVENDGADVTSRVKRLVDLSGRPSLSGRPVVLRFISPAFLWGLSLLLIAFSPLVDPNLYSAAHNAIEGFVYVLQ